MTILVILKVTFTPSKDDIMSILLNIRHHISVSMYHDKQD